MTGGKRNERRVRTIPNRLLHCWSSASVSYVYDTKDAERKEMKVIRNEQIIWCDVDSTLIEHHEGTITVDYYGEKRKVKPHQEHISFLRSLKKRGCYIIVHSNNGYVWAETIVKALKLEDTVDQIMSKPYKVIDDAAPELWMPRNIWIQDKP